MYLSTLQAEMARINKTIKDLSKTTGISYKTLKSRFNTGKFNVCEIKTISNYINNQRDILQNPLKPLAINELFNYLDIVG